MGRYAFRHVPLHRMPNAPAAQASRGKRWHGLIYCMMMRRMSKSSRSQVRRIRRRCICSGERLGGASRLLRLIYASAQQMKPNIGIPRLGWAKKTPFVRDASRRRSRLRAPIKRTPLSGDEQFPMLYNRSSSLAPRDSHSPLCGDTEYHSRAAMSILSTPLRQRVQCVSAPPTFSHCRRWTWHSLSALHLNGRLRWHRS
jgi:hypothetical protein